MTRNRIDVVLPVHNEAESIAATLRELHHQVSVVDGIPIRFVICEDGSTDGSLAVLAALQKELPILLIHGEERKSYSKAVLDGLRACSSEVVAAMDADGQCDPSDFRPLLEAMGSGEMIIGYRRPRVDPWLRRVMSWVFRRLYRVLFRIRAKDPSCPYILIRRPLLDRVLADDAWLLRQGFWWEFLARATAEGADIAELPVRHRPRASGRSRVFHPADLPGIVWSHVLGLIQLRRALTRPQSFAFGSRSIR